MTACELHQYIAIDSNGDKVFDIHNPDDQLYDPKAENYLTTSQALVLFPELNTAHKFENHQSDLMVQKGSLPLFAPGGFLDSKTQPRSTRGVRLPLTGAAVAIVLGGAWWFGTREKTKAKKLASPKHHAFFFY